MKAALLPDRGVVKVAGDDARKFLNGLVTTDIGKVDARSTPRFAALLTPQGKIIVDFIVAEARPADGGGFFLDCPRALAPTLGERLNFYKLRAKVIDRGPVRDARRAGGLGRRRRRPTTASCYPDPRLPALGLRCMLPPHLAGEAAAELGATLVDAADYEAHRIALGVPRGGARFHLWRRLPARSRHGPARRRRFRQGLLSSARKWCRAWSIAAPRAPASCRSPSTAPPPEAGIAGDGRRQDCRHDGLGRAGRGLAMLRLDRVADALAAARRSSPAASRCASSSRPGRALRFQARRRRRNERDHPPCRRPDALPLAEARSALRRLSRRRMGRAGIRRPRALREADARRLPGRPVVDHHPAQARQFPPRLRRLRAGEDRALHAEEGRAR